jgi:myo-inositol-1(or 4)-monophosphatase
VALRYKDEIVLGVNGLPMENSMYWAIKGQGAFKNGSHISVSKHNPSSLLVFLNNGYSDIAHERCKIQTQRISNRFAKRSFGSTVVELSLVAEGKFDAFLCSGDKIWDFAASILLVQEAGGIVSDWAGNPFTLDRDDLICANPAVHSELVEISRDLLHKKLLEE